MLASTNNNNNNNQLHINGIIDQNIEAAAEANHNGNGNEKAGGQGGIASPFTKFVQGNIFKNFFK